MEKIIKLTVVLIAFMISSCDPRIEMDMAQWGDHAVITNVQIFKYEVDDDPALYETMNDISSIEGYRRIIISNTATIDLDNFSVSVPLKGNETLDKAGFIFYHKSVKIEPLEGAPLAGHIADLSKGNFKYQLVSADGTVHDWNIKIVK